MDTLRRAVEVLADGLERRRPKDGSPYECGLQNQAQYDARELRALLAAHPPAREDLADETLPLMPTSKRTITATIAPPSKRWRCRGCGAYFDRGDPYLTRTARVAGGIITTAENELLHLINNGEGCCGPVVEEVSP